MSGSKSYLVVSLKEGKLDVIRRSGVLKLKQRSSARGRPTKYEKNKNCKESIRKKVRNPS